MQKVSRDDVIVVLESIARLLELKGENGFKIRAYTNAARALELYPGDLNAMAADGRLEEIDGIGEAIAKKISILLRDGRLPYFDDLRDEFPPEIFQLFEIQGLGPKKIKALYDTLQIQSLTKLERACRDGSVAALPGFGQKTALKIIDALEHRKKNAGRFRLGDLAGVAETILAFLRDLPDVNRAGIAGSYRRRKEIVGDLDFIVSSRKPEDIIAAFCGQPLVEAVLAKGPTKASARLVIGIQCDLRVVLEKEYPFAMQYFTGSKEHNVALRGRARDRGWTLNEYALSPIEGREFSPISEIRTEEDLYAAFDLEPIPPELRENFGEFEAAEKGSLPRLIELDNLRGTFHNHTVESDGRNTLEQMTEAAFDLGLEYFGIADHSKSSFQANGLDEKRLEAQMAAIGRLNAEHEGFRILTGTECDILKDGSLDFSDELLSRLDYVVASVHSIFTLGEAEMTDRIIRAMSNPHVTMLGHLTGRLLLTREPYKVNIGAVIEVAAATGTVIELNGNPRRLDMDWRWWPRAKELGVKCAINPDAHRIEDLQFLWHGIATARKGWLTRKDVINTMSWQQMQKWLASPKQLRAQLGF